MAAEYRTFAVVVPAGTPAAAPLVQALAMPARIVRSVRVHVPPGPRGRVGFTLGAAGVQVVPWNPGAWLITDDDDFDWPLEGQISSGAWECRAYNTGRYDHTLYFTFALDLAAGEAPGAPIVPLSPSIIVPPAAPYVPPPAYEPPPDYEPPPAYEPPPPPPPGPEPPPLVEPPPYVPPEPPPADEPPPVVEPPPVIEPPPPPPLDDGYAMARTNALHALQAVYGGPVTIEAVLPPLPGSIARIAYDAARDAMLAVLAAL